MLTLLAITFVSFVGLVRFQLHWKLDFESFDLIGHMRDLDHRSSRYGLLKMDNSAAKTISDPIGSHPIRSDRGPILHLSGF